MKIELLSNVVDLVKITIKGHEVTPSMILDLIYRDGGPMWGEDCVEASTVSGRLLTIGVESPGVVALQVICMKYFSFDDNSRTSNLYLKFQIEYKYNDNGAGSEEFQEGLKQVNSELNSELSAWIKSNNPTFTFEGHFGSGSFISEIIGETRMMNLWRQLDILHKEAKHVKKDGVWVMKSDLSLLDENDWETPSTILHALETGNLTAPPATLNAIKFLIKEMKISELLKLIKKQGACINYNVIVGTPRDVVYG